MVRRINLDMSQVEFKGDVLDIGRENYGIIYNLLKHNEDEISVDYILNESYEYEIKEEMYDTAVIFFSLSNMWNVNERKKLLFQVWKRLKEQGELYIWDYDKRQKEVVNQTISVKFPNNKNRSFIFKNKNPFCEFSLESAKKILEKYYEIEETRVCDRIIFLKAIRKGNVKDEGAINSSKLKIYSQQLSGEIFKGIHKGFRLPRRNKGIFHK
jgi:hypothetical protein